MKQVIRHLHLFVFIFLLWETMPATLIAQSKTPTRITVQGTVLDSITGLPLDFVNIAEKGTTNGTITNTQGDFQMLARP